MYWLLGSELPPIDPNFRRPNSSKMEALNRKITYLLRGWSLKSSTSPHPEFDLRDQSVSWTHLLACVSQLWNRLKATDVTDTLASAEKTRFQVYAAKVNGKVFIARMRAIQGQGHALGRHGYLGCRSESLNQDVCVCIFSVVLRDPCSS